MPNRPEHTPKLDDFLTVSQAADFLGVSVSTMRNWDRSGKVTARRHPVNGYRLYRQRDLEVLVRQLEAQPNRGKKGGRG